MGGHEDTRYSKRGLRHFLRTLRVVSRSNVKRKKSIWGQIHRASRAHSKLKNFQKRNQAWRAPPDPTDNRQALEMASRTETSCCNNRCEFRYFFFFVPLLSYRAWILYQRLKKICCYPLYIAKDSFHFFYSFISLPLKFSQPILISILISIHYQLAHPLFDPSYQPLPHPFATPKNIER